MIRTRLILLLLCALLYACSSTPPEVIQSLEQAESVIDEHPDSALSILDAIEPSTLRHNSKEQAIYALLLTQAREKCHIIQTDDSLISLAVNYFIPQKSSHTIQSLYYRGILNLNDKKYESAMLDFLQANDIAQQTDNHFWKGMSLRGIGDTYSNISNFKVALDYYIKAYNEFTQTNRDAYSTYGLYDIASTYFNLADYQSCNSILDSLIIQSEKKDLGHSFKTQYTLKGTVHC